MYHIEFGSNPSRISCWGMVLGGSPPKDVDIFETLTFSLKLNLRHIVAVVVDHRTVVLAVVVRLAVPDDQGALHAPRHSIHQDGVVMSRL